MSSSIDFLETELDGKELVSIKVLGIHPGIIKCDYCATPVDIQAGSEGCSKQVIILLGTHIPAAQVEVLIEGIFQSSPEFILREVIGLEITHPMRSQFKAGDFGIAVIFSVSR